MNEIDLAHHQDNSGIDHLIARQFQVSQTIQVSTTVSLFQAHLCVANREITLISLTICLKPTLSNLKLLILIVAIIVQMV